MLMQGRRELYQQLRRRAASALDHALQAPLVASCCRWLRPALASGGG